MKSHTSETLNNQAVLLASEGKFDEAIACLTKAIAQESSNSLLWFNLSITYRDKGDYENAKSAMEHAFRMNPTDEEIIEALTDLLIAMEQFEDALAYCAIGLQQNNSNSHLWNLAGVINFNLSQFYDASGAFEHALLINPYYYDALFNLRDTYKEMGNKNGYEECCRRLKQFKKGTNL